MNFRKFAINYLSPVTLSLRFLLFMAALILFSFTAQFLTGDDPPILLGIAVGYIILMILKKAISPWFEDGYSINDLKKLGNKTLKK